MTYRAHGETFFFAWADRPGEGGLGCEVSYAGRWREDMVAGG
jgi:hypothetical protein